MKKFIVRRTYLVEDNIPVSNKITYISSYKDGTGQEIEHPDINEAYVFKNNNEYPSNMYGDATIEIMSGDFKWNEELLEVKQKVIGLLNKK